MGGNEMPAFFGAVASLSRAGSPQQDSIPSSAKRRNAYDTLSSHEPPEPRNRGAFDDGSLRRQSVRVVRKHHQLICLIVSLKLLGELQGVGRAHSAIGVPCISRTGTLISSAHMTADRSR